MIPYGRQDVTETDIAAVLEVLRSDFLTQGPAVPAFEAALADVCAVPNAIAMSSATAALQAAYEALGVGPGKRVWTSPNTFVATSNAALMLGAEVGFVDIDATTYNMSVDALEVRLKAAENRGALPDVIVPVHFAGQSCDMDGIAALARRYGCRVVEDASHAVGGRYRDVPVGACAQSDVTVFSFHPVKIVTTGEGGAATTRDPDLAERMRMFRTHGVTRDRARLETVPDGPWSYEMQFLGYNYRMTDIQAALGRSQLDRLASYIERRHAIAARYDAELADTGIVTPVQAPDRHSALHLYPIQWPDGLGGHDRRTAFEALRADGILVNVHYIPVHLQPHYRRLGFGPGDFPEAEAYYARALSIPMYPTLTDEAQTKVISALRRLARV